MNDQTVGSTRTFVLAKGFTQAGAHAALTGEDDTHRLFAELFADPDRLEVRPQEAYQAILSSIQPGWTLRLLQVFWPDPDTAGGIPNASDAVGQAKRRWFGYPSSRLDPGDTGISPAIRAPDDIGICFAR